MKEIVYVFSKYTQDLGSSRVRFYNYEPFLKKSFTFIFIPLFDKNYIKYIYGNKSKKSLSFLIYLLKSYIKRVYYIYRLKNKKIWLEAECLPYIPFFLEKIIYKRNIIISNYDDAIYHNYDDNKNFLVRKSLCKKIDKVMQYSKFIIVGNKYLEHRALLNNKNTHIIPSVVNLNDYPENDRFIKNKVTIGWIGTPITSVNLAIVEKVLFKLKNKYDFNIVFIGAQMKKNSLLFNVARIVEWDKETELESLQKIDIGIMPLYDTKFNNGKCAFKLIQYMGVSATCVCSPIGMNKDAVKDGINGFWATTEDEWYLSLEKLLKDNDKIISMGKQGYKKFKQEYTYQVTTERILQILKGNYK